jgi:hypothetical protein
MKRNRKNATSCKKCVEKGYQIEKGGERPHNCEICILDLPKDKRVEQNKRRFK